MKIGFFAPLPPAPTGVADYAAALLAALRPYGDIEPNAADSDIALYHLGNNHLHREIYARALAHPGVAVLHDAVLQHFFLGTCSEAEYVEEFVYNYGEWTRGLALDLWRNRARSGADPRYFSYPMVKRLATVSRVVVVHNPAAEKIVRQHNPEARVIEIPHFFVPPSLPSSEDTQNFRRRLGINPRTLVAGVFGHLRESKRIHTVLRAMERVWREGVDAILVVQGAFASSDLERSIAPRLENRPRILRAGHLSQADFWSWAAATDVCINLRFPTAAETSGIAVSMMGIGKTVIFTAGEEIARIPETACLSVDRGPDEEEILAAYLRWLAADRNAALEIGRRAAEHIAHEHALEKVARQYWDALNP